jgi:hypothetical protein
MTRTGDAISGSVKVHCVYESWELFPSLLMHPLRRLVLLFIAPLLSAALSPGAEARVLPVPVPKELLSSQFKVEINGRPADVAHAAASYDFVSIEATTAVRVSITATENGFWDRGVDIQPWRLGIRPQRNGNTIEFELKDVAKLSISRPGDFLNHAKILFLFVAHPAPLPPKNAPPSFHFIGPGIHRGSLNPKNGETYYLAPGAVVFGSINLWKVHDVKIMGHGVIVYDGPQNPEDDDGWMQKQDWHCIGALESHHIEIDGLTCLIRSRTWSVQMKDSTDFVYDDLRVIGGNPGNANQDGMDWLGGGNTVVRDSFFRASDDVFALQGNWDGYGHAAMIAPGHDVSNITIEHSVLSTSISNIVRTGWPEKTFNSHTFTLRDSDILQGGIGSCGLPFALFTFWGKDGAKGTHSGYTFENLWMDDWYSLFQIEQEQPGLQGFTFRNIWSLEQPPLVSSRLEGQVKDVHIENVKYGQAVVTSDGNLPVRVSGGAQQPTYTGGDKGVRAMFHVTPQVLEAGDRADFEADTAANPHARYNWIFGDGTTATGQSVRHRFPDALGTQLDGPNALGTNGKSAGRFRVLLQVVDKQGHQDWAAQDIAVVGLWHGAVEGVNGTTQAGLQFQIYPGTWPELPSFKTETAVRSGVAAKLGVPDSGGFTRYAIVYSGLIEVPTDGGYSFHLLSRDGARLVIDGEVVALTGPPFGEVCGSPVNAVRNALGTIALRAGKHVLRLESLQSMSPASPRLQWSGPGISLVDVPAAAFSHRNLPSIQARPTERVSIAKP